jgi:hypothetical protein
VIRSAWPLVLIVLLGCGRGARDSLPMSIVERQLTNARHGHILTNAAVWSPDSRGIVYDVRSDPAGSVFDGSRIERVNVETGSVDVLFEAPAHHHVGVATVNPTDGRVVFIHGPDESKERYAAWNRRGVIVDPAKPGTSINLDARDLTPPFTPGALRGGSHVHTWNDTGTLIAFTYEDQILATVQDSRAELNRRTVAIAVPDRSVIVPRGIAGGYDGSHWSVVVAETVSRPQPGTDEIGRAYEEAWIPGQRALTFIGEVVAGDGRRVQELFRLDLPEQFDEPGRLGPLQGTPTTLPRPPAGVRQTRLTRFADQPGHSGIATSPRHWPRTSPDRTTVAFLTGTGQLQFLDLNSGVIRSTEIKLTSAFTWHPRGWHLVAAIDDHIAWIDAGTGHVAWSTPSTGQPVRLESVVVSPDGRMIAYVRQVDGFNQIFVATLPAEILR